MTGPVEVISKASCICWLWVQENTMTKVIRYHDIAAAAAEFIVAMTAVVKMCTVVSALAVVAPLLLPSWWCM